jgi:hypothetical protein
MSEEITATWMFGSPPGSAAPKRDRPRPIGRAKG